MQQEQTSLVQEFVFFMLPGYIFNVLALLRLSSIRRQPLVRTTNLMHHISYFLPSQEHCQLEDPPDSFILKLKMNLLLSAIYGLQFVLGVIGSPQLFYSSNHRIYSVCYLLGCTAWYLSAVTLKFQFQRGLSQSIWCHRLYWPISCIFQVLHLIQSYQLYLFNMIFNGVQLLCLGVLAMYALFKWTDFNSTLSEFEEGTPNCARTFFLRVQGNQILRKYLQLPTVRQSQIEMSLISTQVAVQLKGKNKIQEEEYLLQKLPRRNLSVNRQPKIVMQDGFARIQYVIISQFGGSQKVVERKLMQIVQLNKFLGDFYSTQNFNCQYPVLDVQKLRQTQEELQKIILIEAWLNSLLLNPFFLHQRLLNFLQVIQEERLYINNYIVMTMRRRATPQYRLKSNQPNRASHYIGQAKQEGQQSSSNHHLQNIKAKHEFKAKDCQNFQRKGKSFLFRFQITMIDSSISWLINKTYQDFKNFDQELEAELKRPLSLFYTLTAKFPLHTEADTHTILQLKKQLCFYLTSLLGNHFYFTRALFKFIEFDLQNEMPFNYGRDSSTVSNYQANTSSQKSFKNQKAKACDVNQEIYFADIQTTFSQSRSNFKGRGNPKLVDSFDLSRCRVLVRQIRKLKVNGQIIPVFILDLTEYNKEGNQQRIVRLKTQYSELTKFSLALQTVYQDLQIKVPLLPPYELYLRERFQCQQAKRNIQRFFQEVLSLRKIENWDRLRKLLRLEQARDSGQRLINFVMD